MKQRFSNEQIIGFLKEAELGVTVEELCWRHGFSCEKFNRWRRSFSGMKAFEASRLKELEAENENLKRRLAELMPENEGTIVAPRKQ